VTEMDAYHSGALFRVVSMATVTDGASETTTHWVSTCGAPETGSGASGLRLPSRGEFEPFPGKRTSLPRSLASTASRSTLLRSIITSPSLLVPLGMRISERRALLKRDSRLAHHQCQLRGAHACFPYHPLSSSSWRFDRHRVHRAPTIMAAAPLGSSPGHIALYAHVLIYPWRGEPSGPDDLRA
jgi:hypothetical protein